MLEARIRETAEEFWKFSGLRKRTFPLDIESALSWSLPLFLLRVPNLWIHNIEHYLVQQQLPALLGGADRPLHGCVVALRGKGLVMVDGTDTAPEIRFTIAHEVAHFILDYLAPRQRALVILGAGVDEVLDGYRAPTANERADALLANVSLGLYAHFMHRDESGFGDATALDSEDQADRLAFELVAPEDELWRALPKDFKDRTYRKRVETVRRLLIRRFGLPSEASCKYATIFCRTRFGGASVREWLGIT